MLKLWSQIYGGVLTLIGIAGFFLSSNESLQLTLTHNLIHLVSGLIYLGASLKENWNRLAMRVFGILYGLLAVYGLFSDQLFGLVNITLTTEIFNFIVALGALYLGFVHERISQKQEKKEQANT